MNRSRSRSLRRHVAALAALGILAVTAAPASATTVAGPGGVTVATSDTNCHTLVDYWGRKTQTILAYSPGVTALRSMPSGRVRWTAYLQWAPATAPTTWRNWQSKSLTANVSGGAYSGFYVPFEPYVQWNVAVPSNSYLFRTYNLVEFLNSAGTPVAATAWILADRYSTLVRVDTGNVSTTINQLAWGECRI